MTLGENIARLRTQKDWSQGDLADALGISRQSISKWETDTSIPELEKLIKLSELFGVTLDQLVRGEDAPETESVPASSACLLYTSQPGDHQADNHQHRQILGKQTVGVFPAALAQIDGDDGAGAHGEQHGNGEHDIHKGNGQIDSAHGVFAHALGHEQAVYNGVQGEHHQRGHRGGGEVEELGEQTALVQHFG